MQMSRSRLSIAGVSERPDKAPTKHRPPDERGPNVDLSTNYHRRLPTGHYADRHDWTGLDSDWTQQHRTAASASASLVITRRRVRAACQINSRLITRRYAATLPPHTARLSEWIRTSHVSMHAGAGED